MENGVLFIKEPPKALKVLLKETVDDSASKVNAPTSTLYKGGWWKLGSGLVKLAPPGLLKFLAEILGNVYRLTHTKTTQIVRSNLEPVVGTNAPRATKSLFTNFGSKLIDLWRFEIGKNFGTEFCELNGWKFFETANAKGKGVLLVTIHLGNWEIGADLFAGKGVPLLVVTAEEPDSALTLARKNARLSKGIKTTVVGGDGFGFVEVIRQLTDGGVAALLIDRPHPSTSIGVTFLGKELGVSSGPVEIARASGCAILPVYVVKTDGAYSANILPELVYDRAQLRDPVARYKVAGELMRAFEPAVKQYYDQWYHFVPIWHS